MITGYCTRILLEQGEHVQLHEVITSRIPTQDGLRDLVREAAGRYGFRLAELVHVEADCEPLVGAGDPLN